MLKRSQTKVANLKKKTAGQKRPSKRNPKVYAETRRHYNRNAAWHGKKSQSYNWHTQLDRFAVDLKGKKVLDAGCGTGRDIAGFIEHNVLVEGLDSSTANLRIARARFSKVKFHQGDLRNLNLGKDRFDGIWACASVLNLRKKDLPKALAKFKKTLKSEGKLFISVKEGSGEKMVKDEHGQRFFSFYKITELTDQLKRAGFKIADSEIVPDSKLTGQESAPGKPNGICIIAAK